MDPFFYPSYYPGQYYGSEPPVNSRDWMMDMDPWYGSHMHPFRHSPFGYRRPVHPPAAPRRRHDDGRLWGDVFTPRRSRVTSARLPFQQLFDDELFKAALTDDVIGLLEHHSQKLDEAKQKSEDTGANAAAKDTTPGYTAVSASPENASPDAATPTTGGEDTAKPSTSSVESSKDPLSSDDKAKKEVEEKKEKQPCDGYILHFERTPFGFYRPVYSPVTLRREQQAAAPFRQLLDDDFFKSSFTDDLLSLLEHHVTGLDDVSKTKPGNESTENATSSGGAVARKEDVDKTGKPFNVALKLGDFHPENVNVSLDGRKVIVKAKREEQGDDDSWKRHSHVEYSFMLPEDTPAESLTSSFNKDGVLSITAKKDDAASKPLEGPPQKEGETEQKKEAK